MPPWPHTRAGAPTPTHAQGASHVPKLADFGLSREEDAGLTSQAGTPLFAAPEVLRGDAYGASVDVWSFGCLLACLDSRGRRSITATTMLMCLLICYDLL